MADPLVRPNKKRRAPPQSTEPNGASSHDSKGELLHPQTAPKSLPNHLAKPKSLGARPSPPPHALLSGSGITTSGFSETPTQPYTDYPLVVTKRAFREGLRHHVARFASKQNVDPSDTNEFTRPVRLHRRDPRTTPGGPGGVKEEEEDGLPAEERERRDRERAEKAAQREADAAQIAPSADKGVSQRKIPFGKKVQTVYRNDQTEGKKAQSKLRYEEALPWHLEDFDNKSIWVGNYEDALSGRYAALSHGEDGVFRVTPLEKWYKFTPKNKFQSFTLDEAEKKMGAKVKQDRFGKEAQERKDRAAEEDRNRKLAQGFFVGKTGSANPNFKSENALADDLDFDEDRFADDEETPFMENTKDAEEKETEAKIKLEQLQANAFALRDEKEADRQEEVEQKVSENLKKVGKRVKKAIVKREKNYIYESDSGQDPYTESVCLPYHGPAIMDILLTSHRANPKTPKPSSPKPKSARRKKPRTRLPPTAKRPEPPPAPPPAVLTPPPVVPASILSPQPNPPPHSNAPAHPICLKPAVTSPQGRSTRSTTVYHLRNPYNHPQGPCHQTSLHQLPPPQLLERNTRARTPAQVAKAKEHALAAK